MPDREPKRVSRWAVNIPALAVPVRAVVASRDSLDPLEIVVLRLASRRPRSAGELEYGLGLRGRGDIVRSAVESLIDKGLLETEAGGVLVRASERVSEWLESGSRIIQSWALFSYHDRAFIPTLLERLSGGDGVSAAGTGVLELLDADADAKEHEPPDLAELDRALQRLVVRYEPELVAAEVAVAVADGADGMHVVSACLDRSRSRRNAQIVAVAEFVPTRSGPPEIYVHEPAPDTVRSRARAVSPAMAAWLKACHPEVWRPLEGVRNDLFLEMSPVLSAAGFASPREVEVRAESELMVALETAGWHVTGMADLPAGLSESMLSVYYQMLLLEAHPRGVKYALRNLEHAIEWLLGELRAIADPTLRHIADRVHAGAGGDVVAAVRRMRAKEEMVARLNAVGLPRGIGPSATHLDRALSRLQGKHIPEEVLRPEGSTGGGNLTLFLLPLFLLDESDAVRYAEPIAAAAEASPSLFDDLALLLDVRNGIAHERDDAAPELRPYLADPRRVERLLVSVVAALRWLWARAGKTQPLARDLCGPALQEDPA